MRKVYEYRNKAQAELVVVSPSGKTRYKYKFTGGVMDPKNKIHAKYTTDSVIMQQALERSEYFNKVVFLVASFGTAPIAQTQPVIRKTEPMVVEQPIQTAPSKGRGGRNGRGTKPVETVENVKDVDTVNTPGTAVDEGAEDAVRVFEDVTTLGEAASILTSEGDVVATDLLTIEGALKVAKEKGISFPNLN